MMALALVASTGPLVAQKDASSDQRPRQVRDSADPPRSHSLSAVPNNPTIIRRPRLPAQREDLPKQPSRMSFAASTAWITTWQIPSWVPPSNPTTADSTSLATANCSPVSRPESAADSHPARPEPSRQTSAVN